MITHTVGGEGKAPIGRKAPVSPWGQPALVTKHVTRKLNQTNFIVRRRQD